LDFIYDLNFHSLVCSGSMQKKIEEDTGVKIIFPSSRDETSVGIYICSCFYQNWFGIISF